MERIFEVKESTCKSIKMGNNKAKPMNLLNSKMLKIVSPIIKMEDRCGKLGVKWVDEPAKVNWIYTVKNFELNLEKFYFLLYIIKS